MQPKEIIEVPIDSSPQGLVEAFESFNQASAKLERRYRLLQDQVVHLTKQLEQKELEIKQAEKLATLGETAAAMAHEIRNPLGAMKLFVSILKEDMSDRPESLEIIDQIEKSMGTLNHVVTNILQFSKKNNGKTAPINFHSLVKEQVEYIESEFPQVGIHIQFSGNPFVRASEHGIRQVLRNLFMNSMQEMKGEGEIKLSMKDGDRGELIFQLEDSGTGVPEELISKVFEPFVTSKNEGTGLGLAVVKQIIEEQHQGKVRLCNKPGRSGVIVEVELPRPLPSKIK